jgi:hypothetical protein
MSADPRNDPATSGETPTEARAAVPTRGEDSGDQLAAPEGRR